jgi:hypothetical protein
MPISSGDGSHPSFTYIETREQEFLGYEYFFSNVSWEPQRPTAEPVPIPLPPNFRDLVQARLDSGDCNAFIAKLIKQAAEYTVLKNGDIVKRSSLASSRDTGYESPYAVDGSDALKKTGSFVTIENLQVNGRPVGGTVSGSIPQTSAQVQLTAGYRLNDSGKGYAERATRLQISFYISTAVHELVHLAGKYFNDQVLALAAKDLGATTQSASTNYLTGSGHASDVYNDALMKHCGPQAKTQSKK